MRILVAAIVLGMAYIDGGYLIKERKTREVLAYGGILILALGIMIIELSYFRSFVIIKVITTLFRPIGEPLIMFLRQY